MGQAGSALLVQQAAALPGWLLGRPEDERCDALVQGRFGAVRGKTIDFGTHRVRAFLGVPFARCGTFEERFTVSLTVLIFVYVHIIHMYYFIYIVQLLLRNLNTVCLF